jgi:predicted nucleic acid-binding protein
MQWSEIKDCLDSFRRTLRVEPLTIETHDQALYVAERYNLSFYDALIISAAKLSGCAVLYSEDLQHGQVFDKSLIVRNPFKVG